MRFSIIFIVGFTQFKAWVLITNIFHVSNSSQFLLPSIQSHLNAAQSGSAHCQKHIESVADLISNYPFKKVSSEEYYVNITRQVINYCSNNKTLT